MAPLPKKKHSRSRTRRSRAHMGKTRVQLSKCSSCPSFVRPHHACPKCGVYKDNYYVDPPVVEKKVIDFITK